VRDYPGKLRNEVAFEAANSDRRAGKGGKVMKA
jgi:hypothetical protein